MTTYVITVSACDGSTKILVDLDDTEAAVIRRVAEQITATSTYNCEPRMRIVLAAEYEDGDDD